MQKCPGPEKPLRYIHEKFLLQSLFAISTLMTGADLLAQQQDMPSNPFPPDRKKYDATLTYIQGGRCTRAQFEDAKNDFSRCVWPPWWNTKLLRYTEIGGKNAPITTNAIEKGFNSLKGLKSDRHIVVLDFQAGHSVRTYPDSTKVHHNMYLINTTPHLGRIKGDILADKVLEDVGNSLEALRDKPDEHYDILILTPDAATIVPSLYRLPAGSRVVTAHEKRSRPL